MTETGALIAFLAARLDEDERYLNSNRHHLWTQRPVREVAAKRAIIESECGPYVPGHVPATVTLRHLAAVWSDHPDTTRNGPWLTLRRARQAQCHDRGTLSP